MPGEKLRLHVVRALGVDLLEEPDRVLVVAVTILVTAEHVVELPEELFLLGVVEASHLFVAVLADALDDVRGLRELSRELREPAAAFSETSDGSSSSRMRLKSA